VVQQNPDESSVKKQPEIPLYYLTFTQLVLSDALRHDIWWFP